MDKLIAISWMEIVFLPMVEMDSCLFIDSWDGFKKMLEKFRINEKNLRFEVLPPGSTEELQPADVYFNRTLKQFIRLISDRIRWRHKDFVLSVLHN